MGATSAMFGQVWRERVRGEYHDRPVWSGEKTLRDIAERLIERDRIADGDEIIGTSMGGMVALEIAKLRKLARVILIASAVDNREINGMLRKLHPCMRWMPLSFLQWCCAKVPVAWIKMFSESDPAMIQVMSKAVFAWEGAGSGVRYFRLHGTHDRVISRPQSADRLINGGHMIVMRHAEECIEWLESLEP